ncbi:MAG: outer membrane lipoprotein carrier protein LolA [Methylococcales bacterium]|jgi:outer membrane lipoprotein carrier protein|nr:outer membrane lipoprotein carrier protein LolA [Methylococcaceae bacterium]HIL41222.1 outer membrane lipoprotein carrier protein LolA [Methylococcales bacterium]
MHKLVLGLFLGLLPGVVFASDENASKALSLFFKSTESLSASFVQTNWDEQERVTDQSEGEFVLVKPDGFFWHYKSPFVQKIVAANHKVWFYDVDLEQVTIKSTDKLMGFSPLLFLTGTLDLERDFVVEMDSVTDAVVWLRVTPKGASSSFEYIRMGLVNGQLGSMEFEDNFGRKTQLQFSDMKVNVTVDPALFVLSIPDGVDVFEE